MVAELRGIQETMKTAFFGMPGMIQNVTGGLNLTRDVARVLDNTIRAGGFQDLMGNYKARIESEQRRTDISKEAVQKNIDKLYDEMGQEVKKQALTLFDRASVTISSKVQEQNTQIQKLVSGAVGYFRDVFKTGGTEAESLMIQNKKKATGTQPVSGVDYNILSTNAANPNASATLTGALSVGGKGNVVMNNPVFQNTYSPTVQPTLGGISTPQDFIDLLNKGGVQLSEQMARNVFESLKKLDVSTKAA
jgi:hypothetical protein